MKKTLTHFLKGLMALLVTTVLLAVVNPEIRGQNQESVWSLSFSGFLTDQEGALGWDADGTGPEPYGVGHQVPLFGFLNMPYYAASRDYDDIDPDPEAALAHLLEPVAGFSQFMDALTNHGYSIEQLKIKMGLSSLEDDVEGTDWFIINANSHSLYYGSPFYLFLDDEALIWGTIKFNDCYSSLAGWFFETSFFKPDSAWSPDISTDLKEIGQAFLADVGDEEIRLITSMYGEGFFDDDEGRSGMIYSVAGKIEKGLPELPFMGLATEHQGMAGWNADGNGPEPDGDGHGAQRYYIASRDYGGIDPDPNAAFGHFLPEMKGFLNFKLQMAYRGYSPEQLIMKMGLSSLGNDVYELDWGFENGTDYWCNYYDLDYKLLLNGEELIKGLIDTSHSMMITNPLYWCSGATYDRPRDNSAQSQTDAQIVAAGFLEDLEARKLLSDVQVMTYCADTFNGNGRYNGGYFNIETARLVGIYANCGTFVQCDSLCNGFTDHTTWTAEHSPYFLDNNILIDEGHTLIIEPDVDVRVRGPYSITVKGAIDARATEENPILFTSSNPNVHWNSFRLYDIPPEADSSVFERCIFENALATTGSQAGFNSGGAIKVRDFSKLRFSNCTFRYNQVYWPTSLPPSGGAIALWGSSPLIEYCEFHDNKAGRTGVGGFGGAIICYQGSDPMIKHSLFYDNIATADAGAIVIWEDCAPTLLNNTITGNYAEKHGGGVFLYDCGEDSVMFINNILWNNASGIDSQQVGVEPLLPVRASFSYNDIQGGLEGIDPNHDGIYYAENNIDEYPHFCELEESMYTLTELSPCLTSGMGGNYIGAFGWGCYEGISDAEDNMDGLNFYPNPVASGHISVSFFMGNPGQARLEIYNLTGEKVSEPMNGYYASGEHRVTFSVEGLPAGIYFGRLTDSGQSITTGFVRMK